ncbi:hypothetical protein SAMN05444166_6187 [Singulisphaera sp. GP187]|uniref:hypothetical protein n=1 Tax=Singulisphaera sp. GP187 TaxID=1882752 RepID=UPI00092A36DD|nr:hypothetical protein [Singulisphaera sp. GP187]SIO59848.1 hypothetical protein SAMN05444166_6187 [Singulisphaera sp. GP187]
MNTITYPLRIVLATLPLVGLVAPGCRPPQASDKTLPPAYTFNQIADPALHQVADEIQTWASQQAGTGEKPLYSRIEVLPPVPIVQPYGVGVFQQEVRLPVIFTTGPGWAGMKLTEKEAAVVQAFHHISERLQALNHKPALQSTLTIQTPQGMELTWINQLDPSGKNVHGDE